MPEKRSTLHGLVSLVVCGLLAGVVVAAAAFPAAAFGGLAAKDSSDAFRNLPSDLRIPQPAQSSYLYANDGRTLITTLYDDNRRDVSLSRVAPVMRHAMVDAEDVRFYRHGGVDLRGVLRSLVSNGSSGDVQQGASTLTMQYVRNVLKNDDRLSPSERSAASADTAGRKLREMRYAIALEHKLSKDQILERYLNIAYFGEGAYGVYAAAETYFGTDPGSLTLAEAATLAGLVQQPPGDITTADAQKYATGRRGYVLASMVRQHDASGVDADTAKRLPLAGSLHLHPTPDGCSSVPADSAGAHQNSWGFLCDYVIGWWDSQPAFGATVAEREKRLRQGGYSVVTSLDPAVQRVAMDQSLGVYGYDNPKAMPIAVVQPGTGRVLAMAVNRHYGGRNPSGRNTYPNTVNPLISGGNGFTGYQTGSTYKMFTMLAALQQGKPLNTGTTAQHQYTTPYPVGGGDADCSGHYCVTNDNPSWMEGYRTMWDGFGRSVNTYFVWLETQLHNGPQDAANMAKAMGISFEGDVNQGYTADHPASDAYLAAHASQWGAFTLGVAATFPLELANAYATVAAEGTYCAPLPVRSITDSTGHQVDAAKPSCHPVQVPDPTTGNPVTVPPDVFRAAADAARCPVNQQSAFGKCNGATGPGVNTDLHGRPVAGKTGTAQHESTESFAGFTPNAAAAGTAVDPADPNDYVGTGMGDKVNDAVANTLYAYDRTQPERPFTAPSARMAFGASGHDSPPPTGR